jgi:hypothetical protein
MRKPRTIKGPISPADWAGSKPSDEEVTKRANAFLKATGLDSPSTGAVNGPDETVTRKNPPTRN